MMRAILPYITAPRSGYGIPFESRALVNVGLEEWADVAWGRACAAPV